MIYSVTLFPGGFRLTLAPGCAIGAAEAAQGNPNELDCQGEQPPLEGVSWVEADEKFIGC